MASLEGGSPWVELIIEVFDEDQAQALSSTQVDVDVTEFMILHSPFSQTGWLLG